ncbi:MAG: hypothetical protein M0001_08500, partial [Treponema sp.]|nr:hypothetical protein [Treponema sp.]
MRQMYRGGSPTSGNLISVLESGVNADLILPVFADEILPVSRQSQSKPEPPTAAMAPTRSLSFMR